MTPRLFLPLAALALSACDAPWLGGILPGPTAPVPAAAPAPGAEPRTLDPAPPPPPPPQARTVEEFDTTTQAARAEALAAQDGGGRQLGTTQATLGAAGEPGIWLKTPLVQTVTLGRIEWQGTEINVELRPSGGPAGSGSQLSLAAMRLIGAPLTDIVELAVYRR